MIAVRQSVSLAATPEQAFALFTTRMSRWFYPHVINNTVIQDLILEPQVGGRWLQRDEGGLEKRWGEVLAWEPPARVLLAWRITPRWEYDPDLLTQLEVRFVAHGAGSEVHLEHRLDGYGAAAPDMLETLDVNWQTLLDRFAGYVRHSGAARRGTEPELTAHGAELSSTPALPAAGASPSATKLPGLVPEGASELKQLLREAVKHLDACGGALLVPDRNIALVRRDRESPADEGSLRQLHHRLLRMAQTHRGPLIINDLTRISTHPGAAFRILSCAVRSRDGRALGVLSVLRGGQGDGFTARDAHLAQLLAHKASGAIESNYDPLSGLYTWPAFERGARALLQHAERRPHWSALHIDIDRLHVINEKFGRYVGDAVLRQLGDFIRRRLPQGAMGARIAADRFVVLLPEALLPAEAFAESLRAGAEQLAKGDAEARPPISISVGVAPLDARSAAFAPALSAAETACKAAKDRGRNRVEIYQAADASIVRRFTDIGIAAQLHEAIERSRLLLHAQWIQPLQHDSLHQPHAELLLRMQDENGCIIGPDRFLSAAVRYQMMPSIDRWVITHALKTLSAHAAQLRGSKVAFAINFSGQSLNDSGFADFVMERISGSGLDPGIFCFELTENATVASLSRAIALMQQLRRLGCGVALDDFGTGFSSLSCLRQLPVTMLKIDGSFVRDVRRDARAASMIGAIAQLARGMSIATVAEYVETNDIQVAVAELGVDYAQGFAIGKPQPLAELLRQLNRGAEDAESIRLAGVGS